MTPEGPSLSNSAYVVAITTIYCIYSVTVSDK